MSEETKKKGGFFSRAFGRKSREEKLAEETALRAERQADVDRQMAQRMAAINAAALKAARQQDEAGLSAQEEKKLEQEEQELAQEQALKDAEAAKRLVEERRQNKIKAEQKAEQDAALAKQKLEDKQSLRRELAAREKAEAEEIARLKTAELAAEKEEAARLKAQRELAEKQSRERIEAERVRAQKEQQEKEQARQEQEEREAQEQVKRKALEAQLIKEARLRQEKAEREAVAAKEQAQKQAAQAAQAALDAPPPDGFLTRISSGLKKSTSRMSDNLTSAFNKRKLDAEALEELEDLLIASDLGVGPAMRTAELLAKDKFDKQVTGLEIKIALADVISETLSPLEKPLILGVSRPQILLFVGVNGSGKTTTLGKLAARYTGQGKKVLLAAGDTFRAAAVEQLNVWGERASAPVVSAKLGADAAGLVYDAIARAKAENYDVLMIDTAGRLQNRTELMDELEKIVRVIKKQDESAPHHSILVLDATVGQNALSQTEAFQKTAGITGLIMTKLDGTAKGGVLVALADKFKLPIHAIGIGERSEDLENFSAAVFAAALSGVADAVIDTDG